jgi:hypothetical protein
MLSYIMGFEFTSRILSVARLFLLLPTVVEQCIQGKLLCSLIPIIPSSPLGKREELSNLAACIMLVAA